MRTEDQNIWFMMGIKWVCLYLLWIFEGCFLKRISSRNKSCFRHHSKKEVKLTFF